MSTRTNRNSNKSVPSPQELDLLYLRLVKLFYEKGDRKEAQTVVSHLKRVLAASPDYSSSIRGKEIRSLIAEFRGDFVEAARSREAEIRKILELHTLTANTEHWKYVSQQYDFSDVSDRLDLLAILYDTKGELDRAIATLLESKHYCESHRIPFDAQDLLEELGQARTARMTVREVRRRLLNLRRRGEARGGLSRRKTGTTRL
jgi:hypothetical protein